MACYRPVTAWRPLDGGSISFVERKNCRTVTVKCGQCIGCRIERQEMWAIRCYAESKCHERNSFITLTYNEENYPQYGSLNYEHFQLFMKRLRKKVGKVRFFMCGEYGEQLLRPHYHALLFGLDFSDKQQCNSIRSKHPIFRSPTLEKLWPFGFSSIGEVNYATARYCAAYAIKKVTGDLAVQHYSRVVDSTGEIVQLEPEFCSMSLRPGIGEPWLRKYWKDVYSVHDAVIVGGKKRPVPRYFDKKLDEISPLLMDHIEFERISRASAHADDNTRERLAVREHVENARVNFNKSRSSSSAI